MNTFFRLRQILILFFVGFVIAAILTWPFITKLGTFYKDGEDYSVFASVLHYNLQSFSSGLVFDWKKYFHGYQFYPQPNTLAYGDHLITLSLISAAIFFLTNDFILSVNLMIFINFILAFIIGFYLINSIVKSQLASLIGSAILVFNPLFLTHFPDHIYGYFALIAVFFFAVRLVRWPTFKNAALLGLSFITIFLTMAYLALFAVLFIPVFLAPFLIFYILKKDTRNIASFVKCGLVGLFFIPAILYLTKPYVEFSKNENITRTVEETVFFSARALDWFSANPNNLLYGKLVRSYENSRAPGPDFNGQYNYREHTLFLNLIPLTLFIVGLVFVVKRFKRETVQFKLLTVSLGLVLLLSFIFTFGPYFLGWNGNTTLFKMPYYYLFENIFFLRGLRVPTRFQMVFYIPFAVFAAYGVYALRTWITRAVLFKALIAVIFAAFILENINSYDFSSTSANLGKLRDRDFQKEIGFLSGKKVLHLPIHIPELGEWSFYTLNWGMITNAISLNGITGYAPPDQLDFLIRLKKGVGEEELKMLAAINADYIMFHKELLLEEEDKYRKDWDLYKRGAVYESDQLLIVDLKKYHFDFQICDLEKDLQGDVRLATLENTPGTFYALILKNKSDCYLPSVYGDKYRQLKFQTSFMGTWERTAIYRMPVVIGPFEEIVLSEPAKSLRVE